MATSPHHHINRPVEWSARLRGTRRNQRKAKAATPALRAQPRAVMFRPWYPKGCSVFWCFSFRMKHGQALYVSYDSAVFQHYRNIFVHNVQNFVLLNIGFLHCLFFHMIHDIPKSWHIWHRLVCIRVDGMALQHLNMIIPSPFSNICPSCSQILSLCDCCVCVAEGKAYRTWGDEAGNMV